MSKGVMRSSFMKMEEEMKSGEKAGIGSILKLTSDAGPDKARPSLRRTFSADMSSRKWMEAQTMKKVPSQTTFAANHVDHVHEYSSSSSEDEEEVEERRRKSSFSDLMKDLEGPKQADVWSSIQSQKPPVPRPYIRPLVKSCTSPISQCSLEMCTESLGSETGAVNGCWQDLTDQPEVEYEEEKMKRKARMKMRSELNVKKCPDRDFPPPLSSDGSRMQMRTHRIDGRLVVAAVPVSTPLCLRAERQDGRLLLTMAKAPPAHSLKPETESEPVQHKKMKTEQPKLFGSTSHKLMSASPRSWSTATILDMDGTGEERLVTTKTAKVAAMGMLPQLAGSYETGLEQSRRLGMASARSGRALPMTDKKFFFGSCKEATARILMWVPNCIATT